MTEAAAGSSSRLSTVPEDPPLDTTTKTYKHSIQGRLDLTAAKVYRDKATADRLLALWRSSLMRLTYLVILLTLNQVQAPITDCIKSIKAINHASDIDQVIFPISLWKTFTLVWMDSICEVVSIVMAAFLAAFLGDTKDFQSPRYQVATSMIPLVLSLYYHKKPLGCLQGTSWERDLALVPVELQPVSGSIRMRGFPVVLIFHAVVTASVWYMARLGQQHAENVAMVQRLQKEMAELKTHANPNPPTSNTSRRSKTGK